MHCMAFRTAIIVVFLIVLFSFILIVSLQSSRVASAPNVTCKILLKGSQIEIDHIIIRGGTSEEIGYELGKIGKDTYGAVLVPFINSTVGKEKETYIRSVDPSLADKTIGIKKAYAIDPANTSVDASAPLFPSLAPRCSAIYFPPNLTKSSHAISGRNADWGYSPTTDDPVNTSKNSLETFSANAARRGFVLEIYPDAGYATLVFGAIDLISGAQDGLNEKGLVIQTLADDDDENINNPRASFAGGDMTGVSYNQAVRIVLEHCATVDEAKQKLSSLQITMPALIGFHSLIYDTSGKATVFEIDNTTNKAVFTDYFNEAVPFTNYAVHRYPDVTKLVPRYPNESYDDTVRRMKLHNFIANHTGLYSSEDAWTAMKIVEANIDHYTDGYIPGQAERPVWVVVTDAHEKTMVVKYFLKDGPGYDHVNKTHELIFSEPYTFRLEK